LPQLRGFRGGKNCLKNLHFNLCRIYAMLFF